MFGGDGDEDDGNNFFEKFGSGFYMPDDDDKGTFRYVPDMDDDDDHDVMDAFFYDDVHNSTRYKKSNDSSSSDDYDDWHDESEDGTDYDLDSYDYEEEEEYNEALEEAKHGWRAFAEVNDLGVFAEDYETEEEYNEALEEAKHGWRAFAEANDLGVFAEDYETEEEYNEAVEEAKYGWRTLAEDNDLGVFAENYETEEEYNEAVEEERNAWRNEAEDGLRYSVDPEDYETEEEYEDAINKGKWREVEASTVDTAADLTTSTQTIHPDRGHKTTNYSNIQIRKNRAKAKLRQAEKGEIHRSEEELERYRFIATDQALAARYLTVDGEYLFAQAVKDHFKLPFELPDEKEEIETRFETLFQDLVEDSPSNAMKIWDWCLDTFMPYIQYAEYKNELTHAVLLDMEDLGDEFPNVIVEYMIQNPAFIDKLISNCTDTLWGVEEFVVFALKLGKIEIAQKIMQCAFANPHTGINDKMRFIKSCIEECSNGEEPEIMASFQTHIFPIVFEETDVRIKNRIPHWQEEMREYLEGVEWDCEQYAYAGSYAWRAKYRDEEIDPTDYESELEYLEAVQERKYSWRKYCNNKFGIDPTAYETRAEYDAASRAEYAKERESHERAHADNLKNATLYAFCMVSIHYPEKPYYYYLTGDVKVNVGDRVMVPFGKENVETEAVVMSVGECFGAAFPCRINLIKSVKRVVAKNEKL